MILILDLMKKLFNKLPKFQEEQEERNLKVMFIFKHINQITPVLKMVNENKKTKYYEWELMNRKNNFQPPFCNMVSIIIESVFENEARSFSQKIFFSIRNKFKNITLLGPVPAIILKKKTDLDTESYLN